MPQRSTLRLSLNLLLICAYLASIISFTNAQGPSLVSDMPYGTVEEKTLYIQGGISLGTIYSQFYSLDLTTSWSTSNPPWKALSTQLAPKDEEDGMAISVDQKSLIVWGFLTGISTYDIASDTWSVVTNVQPASIQPTVGKRIAADPRTGIIYKIASKSLAVAVPQMFIAYNPTTNTTQSLTLPAILNKTQINYYSFVWSTLRNSTLLYGGYFPSTNENNTVFYEYHPDTDSWNELVTYNGTKMLLFGGLYAPTLEFNGIHILDMATLSWTKGSDVDESLRRNNMACSVSGDNFVSWGGNQAGVYPTILLTPAVYNIKNNQWVTQYTPSVPTTSTTTTSSTTTASTSTPANTVNPPSKSGSQTGPIIGGVVAGVVVLAIAGFFIHRRSKKLAKDNQGKTTTSQGHSDIPLVSPDGIPLNKQEFGSHVRLSQYAPSQYQQYQTSPPKYPTPGADPQHYPEQLSSSVLPYPPPDGDGTHIGNPQQLPEQYYNAEGVLLVPPGSPGPRNPQALQEQEISIYSHNNQIPLEEQVAQIKSQYDQQYQNQQQYLEQIRQEQQRRLEMLQRQIAESKR
ncbi:hypothetical protein BGZ79_003056 [Entomortierella chlamydospora]|nr:hypothetical protein BGZ79_003056 [Entomortierella chlamydospora]